MTGVSITRCGQLVPISNPIKRHDLAKGAHLVAQGKTCPTVEPTRRLVVRADRKRDLTNAEREGPGKRRSNEFCPEPSPSCTRRDPDKLQAALTELRCDFGASVAAQPRRVTLGKDLPVWTEKRQDCRP